VVAIPEAEIKRRANDLICRSTLGSDKSAFGLLKKVYAKRAAIRGQQLQAPAPHVTRS